MGATKPDCAHQSAELQLVCENCGERWSTQRALALDESFARMFRALQFLEKCLRAMKRVGGDGVRFERAEVLSDLHLKMRESIRDALAAARLAGGSGA